MIRAIYLLSVSDLTERTRLIQQTLNGETWTVSTKHGKSRRITDREMAELSDKLQSWTLSVYKFGCGFIHLSKLHDYSDSNPFDALGDDERADILKHLRHYHGGPQNDNPTFADLGIYFPMVFSKISDNLECYINYLENNDVEKLA